MNDQEQRYYANPRVSPIVKAPDGDSPAKEDSLLSHNEVLTLVQSCAQGRGSEGLSKSEVIDLINWAENVRRAALCLDLVLAGKFGITWIDGEPAFSAPAQENTPAG